MGKILKLRKACLLAFLFVFMSSTVFPACCFAQDFDDGLHISIPSDWQETELNSDDDNLIYHGVRNDDKLELGIYTQRNFQTNKVNNWKDIPGSELEAEAEAALSSQDSDMAAQMSEEYEIIDTEQMRFLVLHGTVENEEKVKVDILQYTTIINGGSLQFSFYSEKSFTDEQAELCESIVKSAYVDEVKEKKYDTKLILTASLVALAILLLILSVVLHIRSYRRKNVK